MARKDRERARKRHAIERARREGGAPPPREPAERERAKADKRSPGKQRPGSRPAGRNQYAVKGKVGDLSTTGFFGRRQVVRTRDMLIHPRITIRVIMASFVLVLPGLILPLTGRSQPNFQPLTWAAFAICFFGLADLAPTWRQTVPLAVFAVLSLVLATAAVFA